MTTAATGLRLERRRLERNGVLVDAFAPARWTDAQLEAWIDWAGGSGDMSGIGVVVVAGGKVFDMSARSGTGGDAGLLGR